tara:strand:- start:13080 stop:14177 length:1098 start_codon:yes stop_codon:yes gene_type:complete
MAISTYQSVGTPRFWVSALQWLYVQRFLNPIAGNDDGSYLTGKSVKKIVMVNPTCPTVLTFPVGATGAYVITFHASHSFNFHNLMPSKNNFYMLLGHNFGSFSSGNNCSHKIQLGGGAYNQLAGNPYVNFNSSGYSPYDGFSISIGDNHNTANEPRVRFIIQDYDNSYPYEIGSILYGTYYDIEHAPNIDLSMSREYNKQVEHTGTTGQSITNSLGTSSPNWSRLHPWQLAENDFYSYAGYRPGMSATQSGRRVWDLKFQYLDHSSVIGANTSLNNIRYDSTDNINSEDAYSVNRFQNGLLKNYDFFSVVWHKTLGGTLPFVFQPDSNNKSPDQFAICKIKSNSLKINQTAPNLYDIGLVIEEVW